MASALYGALLGLGMFVFARVAPQPIGTITFWSLVSLQLGWHTTRRGISSSAATFLI